MSRVKTYSLHILSIFLAFFIWMYVQSTAEITIAVKSKIHYTLAKDLAFLSNPVKEVRYTVTGPRAIVRSIEKNPSIIKINLSSQSSKQKNHLSFEYNIQNLDLSIPLGVQVGALEPSIIKVQLDKLVSKQVPITLQRIDDIAIDHKMISQKLKPSIVKISGAKSLLDKVKSVETEIIDFKELTETGVKKIRLLNNDKRLTFDTDITLFTYQIETTRSNMILKGIPIKFLSQHTVINSDTRVANLEVLAENISDFKLSKDKIIVVAQIDDNRMGRQTVKLVAKLPKGLYLLKVTPESIEVKVKKNE
jgi:YbbR domain-containing protein